MSLSCVLLYSKYPKKWISKNYFTIQFHGESISINTSLVSIWIDTQILSVAHLL